MSIGVDVIIQQKTVVIEHTTAVELLNAELPTIRHLGQDFYLTRLNDIHFLSALAIHTDVLASLVRPLLHGEDPLVFDDFRELLEVFNIVQ